MCSTVKMLAIYLFIQNYFYCTGSTANNEKATADSKTTEK